MTESEKPQQTEQRECRKCGFQFPQSYLYCPECGKPNRYKAAVYFFRFLVKILEVFLFILFGIVLIFAFVFRFIFKWLRKAGKKRKDAVDADSEKIYPPEDNAATVKTVALTILRTPENIFNFLPLCYVLESHWYDGQGKIIWNASFFEKTMKLFCPYNTVIYMIRRTGDIAPEEFDFFNKKDIHFEVEKKKEYQLPGFLEKYIPQYKDKYGGLMVRFNGLSSLIEYYGFFPERIIFEESDIFFAFRDRLMPVFGRIDFNTLNQMDRFIFPADSTENPDDIFSNYSALLKTSGEKEVDLPKSELWDKARRLHFYGTFRVNAYLNKAQMIAFTGAAAPDDVERELRKSAEEEGLNFRMRETEHRDEDRVRA